MSLSLLGKNFMYRHTPQFDDCHSSKLCQSNELGCRLDKHCGFNLRGTQCEGDEDVTSESLSPSLFGKNFLYRLHSSQLTLCAVAYLLRNDAAGESVRASERCETPTATGLVSISHQQPPRGGQHGSIATKSYTISVKQKQ